MKDFPSRRPFIATEDGYVSASDVEDDLALVANIAADPTEGDQDTETIAIDFVAAPVDYPSLLVQRVFSSCVVHEEDKQSSATICSTYILLCRVVVFSPSLIAGVATTW